MTSEESFPSSAPVTADSTVEASTLLPTPRLTTVCWIYIVKKVSLFTFARCVGKYAAGHADDFPQFITHLRGTDLRIEFEREDVINLDGEALYAAAVDMKLLPKALKLIIPDGLGSGTDIPPLSL